jgi:hypothetical protein
MLGNFSRMVVLFCLMITVAQADGVGGAVARGAARGLARSVGRSASRSVASSVEKQAAKRAFQIQRKDLWNHRHTPVRPLAAPRTVFRYTTRNRAGAEIRAGIAPGRHMTATAPAGRPLSPLSAKRRFGLQKAPTVRETVVVPKGFPVRYNKVPGGSPGFGEITSSKAVPPSAIRKVMPLRLSSQSISSRSPSR